MFEKKLKMLPLKKVHELQPKKFQTNTKKMRFKKPTLLVDEADLET